MLVGISCLYMVEIGVILYVNMTIYAGAMFSKNSSNNNKI